MVAAVLPNFSKMTTPSFPLPNRIREGDYPEGMLLAKKREKYI